MLCGSQFPPFWSIVTGISFLTNVTRPSFVLKILSRNCYKHSSVIFLKMTKLPINKFQQFFAQTLNFSSKRSSDLSPYYQWQFCNGLCNIRSSPWLSQTFSFYFSQGCSNTVFHEISQYHTCIFQNISFLLCLW